MTDLDQQIHSALDTVISAAPPPVPVEAIRSAARPPSLSWSRLWWAPSLPVAAAMLWFGFAALGSSGDSTPSPTVQVQTVDGAPLDDEAPAEPDEDPELRFIAIEGRWLSETIPRVAEQLPGVDQDDLWDALESMEPRPPFASSLTGEGQTFVPGLTNSQLRWEGLLFPSTYFVDQGQDATTVVARMHDEFIGVTAELGYERAMDKVGLSPYEVVIVASMIEADAKVDGDRGKIARVIYNRLAQGMFLGLDSPYIYLAQDRQLEFTQELLEAPGPYGLRTTTGLPLTPISAPGKASLSAAINPTPGPWLFYVLGDEQGNHLFATDLDGHHANVVAARDRGLLD